MSSPYARQLATDDALEAEATLRRQANEDRIIEENQVRVLLAAEGQHPDDLRPAPPTGVAIPLPRSTTPLVVSTPASPVYERPTSPPIPAEYWEEALSERMRNRGNERETAPPCPKHLRVFT